MGQNGRELVDTRHSPSRGNSGFMEDKEVEDISDLGKDVSEKMLSSSQVNDIVKREKLRAAESASERVRRELEEKHQAEIAKLRGEGSNGSNVDTSAIAKQVREELVADLNKQQEDAEREQMQSELKALAEQYHLKMAKGSELAEDFNEITADFDPSAFSEVVLLATKLDNTQDIIYELVKNPTKLQQIDGLAQKSAKLAMKELEKLSQSINQNLEAKRNNVSTPPPLSRPKSSSVGVDNGMKTVKDFKSAPWLRG